MGIDQRVLDLMYPPPERPVQPVERLAVEVIRQAVDDLSEPHPLVRRDAQRFFRGDSFSTWAGFTRLSVPAVRSRLVFLRLVDAVDPGDGE